MKDRAGSRSPTVLFDIQHAKAKPADVYSWSPKTTIICCEVESERYLDLIYDSNRDCSKNSEVLVKNCVSKFSASI